MSRIFVIDDGSTRREVAENELPLRVGGEGTDVVVPEVDDGVVVASIAISEGHPFIQAVEQARQPPVYHNDVRLSHNDGRLPHVSDPLSRSQSRWLKSGDRIEIGRTRVDWVVRGDRVFVSTAAVDVRREEDDRAGRAARAERVRAVTAQPEPAARTLPHVSELPDAGVKESKRRRLMWRISATAFALLGLAAVYVLVGSALIVDVKPVPENVTVTGFPPPVPIGDRWIVMAGSYRVRAGAPGYVPLDETVDVARGDSLRVERALAELPGRVTLELTPSVPFRLAVDGEPVAAVEGGTFPLYRERRKLRIETDRYLPAEIEADILGLDREQTVDVTLEPGWAEVSIVSSPAGAQVKVDDEVVGITPLDVEIMRGARKMELSLDEHDPLLRELEIEAGAELRIDDLLLVPSDAHLTVTSEPAGATVRADGEFHGTTPATIALSPRTAHVISLTRPGYESSHEEVTLAPTEKRDLTVKLVPTYGTVFVSARPADATLLVDGRVVGQATRRLRLPTRAHTLEIRKDGYVSKKVTVTPTDGIARNVEVVLDRPGVIGSASLASTIETADGQKLRLLRPTGPFLMGASRREPGRRANESRRLVLLTRAFYVSEHEVTNARYRGFAPKHRSGMAGGETLDATRQPVVNVSWVDAARYCNWLSERDGLPPAYVERDGKVVRGPRPSPGYRLPTEAEWAFMARVRDGADPKRYGWGKSFPPQSAIANYADASVSGMIADTVPDYSDGFKVAAPVGSFAADERGLYDVSGNVAEWTDDFYALYPAAEQQAVSDPGGPERGEHHTVRGASWRHGNITELRLSYREYAESVRDDLGFRIVRDAM